MLCLAGAESEAVEGCQRANIRPQRASDDYPRVAWRHQRRFRQSLKGGSTHCSCFIVNSMPISHVDVDSEAGAPGASPVM